MVAFVLVDSFHLLGMTDIGWWQTLETSTLGRQMFADISILTTIFAAWMVWGTKVKYRLFFALATLVVGSLAVLPFLAVYFWSKDE